MAEEQAVVMRGVLHFHSETGTEGGYWAFQDERHISQNTTRFSCTRCGAYWDKNTTPDGPPVDAMPKERRVKGGYGSGSYCEPGTHTFDLVSKEDWSYAGLHVLSDGDQLTIFDKADPTKVVWSGKIQLKQHGLFTEHASGMWIHADQVGIKRDVWAKWFFGGNPATLAPAPSAPHKSPNETA